MNLVTRIGGPEYERIEQPYCKDAHEYRPGRYTRARDACVRAGLPMLGHACIRKTATNVHTAPPKHTHAKLLYGPNTSQKQPVHNANTVCIGAVQRHRPLKNNILLARRGGCIDSFSGQVDRTLVQQASFCVQNGGALVSNSPSYLTSRRQARKRTRAGLGAVIGLVHTIGAGRDAVLV